MSSQTAPSTNDQQDRSLTAWTWGVLLLAIACTALIGISRWLFPFDEGRYEGGMLGPADLITRGINPYHFDLVEKPPYVMSPYGPVPYFLIGIGIRLFGFQFQWGRAVFMVSLAVCTWCIGWLAHRYTQQKRLAVFASALFLAQYPTVYWVSMQRPDFLALAFGLVATILVLRSLDDRSQPSWSGFFALFGSALLVTGAVLSRATTLLPIFLICALCISHRAWRELRLFVLGSFGLLAGLIWVFNVTSNGGYVWQQWVLASAADKHLVGSLSSFVAVLTQSPATLVALVIVSLGLRRLPSRHASSLTDSKYRPELQIFLVFALLSGILAFVTTARVGSDLNYWLESLIYLTIAAASLWPRLADESQALWRNHYALCLLLIAASASYSGYTMWQREQFRWSCLPYLRRVVVAIKEHSKPDEPVFGIYPDLALAADRTPYFNNPPEYDHRSLRHYKLMTDAIARRDFPVIINTKREYPGYSRLDIPSEQGRYIYVFVRK